MTITSRIKGVKKLKLEKFELNTIRAGVNLGVINVEGEFKKPNVYRKKTGFYRKE